MHGMRNHFLFVISVMVSCLSISGPENHLCYVIMIYGRQICDFEENSET